MWFCAFRPSAQSDTPVTTDQVYLIDSGAQYTCGTTDTTRTIHLGTPSAHEQVFCLFAV